MLQIRFSIDSQSNNPNNLVNGFAAIGNGGFVQLLAGRGAY